MLIFWEGALQVFEWLASVKSLCSREFLALKVMCAECTRPYTLKMRIVASPPRLVVSFLFLASEVVRIYGVICFFAGGIAASFCVQQSLDIFRFLVLILCYVSPPSVHGGSLLLRDLDCHNS